MREACPVWQYKHRLTSRPRWSPVSPGGSAFTALGERPRVAGKSAGSVTVKALRLTAHGARATPQHESGRAIRGFPHPNPLPLAGEGDKVFASRLSR